MMDVENYQQDYDGNWNFRYRRVAGTMSARAYTRLVKEARRFLDGFGIDWSAYGEPIATFHEMITCTVEWQHKESGQKIILTEVWFDKRTGEINQAGSNYGSLTL